MSQKPQFALSVHQPWAWLIVHGHKDVENRDWPTSFRGRIWIHASKSWGIAERQDRITVMNIFGIEIPETLPLGGLVGEVDITGCVQKFDSPWFQGPWGFVLRDAKPLEFVPVRGQLGLFVPSL